MITHLERSDPDEATSYRAACSRCLCGVEADVAPAEDVDQEPPLATDQWKRLAVAGIWKVMHIEGGKIEAIGKAAGPEAPGAVLRVENNQYEVVFSESGPEETGWIYVADLHPGLRLLPDVR